MIPIYVLEVRSEVEGGGVIQSDISWLVRPADDVLKGVLTDVRGDRTQRFIRYNIYFRNGEHCLLLNFDQSPCIPYARPTQPFLVGVRKLIRDDANSRVHAELAHRTRAPV